MFEWEKFFIKYNIDPNEVKSASIDLEMLSDIYDDYKEKTNSLNHSCLSVYQILRDCESAHTINYRVKNPEHLIAKIIRKNLKNKAINLENYFKEITDLIGFRVIHLFKDDWLDIHEFLRQKWDFYETPTSYIRKGDSKKSRELYEENDCVVLEHEFGYRSVHYLIKIQVEKRPVICEIQVRTIFEEGWSEIDHKLRYPNLGDDKLIVNYLEVFNRLAGSADEMGTFLKDLDLGIKNYKLLLHKEKEERIEALNNLESAIQKLKINEEEKNALREKVADFERKESLSLLDPSNTFLQRYSTINTHPYSIITSKDDILSTNLITSNINLDEIESSTKLNMPFQLNPTFLDTPHSILFGRIDSKSSEKSEKPEALKELEKNKEKK